MSESNWCAPRAEALDVRVAVEHDAPVAHEHGAGLQQVAARDARELVARRDPRDAAVDVQAAAHGVPRCAKGTWRRATPCVRTSPSAMP